MADSDSTSVYRYYDKLGVLIYVGITKTGIERNRQHNADKEWWPLVVSQQVDHFQTRREAHYLEVDLIQRFRPPFNIQHNPAHREMRVAYEGMQDAIGATNHQELWTSLNGALPLDCLSFERATGKLHLNSRIEHAAIGQRLLIDGYPWMVQRSSSKRVGQVTQLVRCGPVIRVEFLAVKRSLDYHSVVAILKQHSRKDANHVYEIRHLLVGDNQSA